MAVRRGRDPLVTEARAVRHRSSRPPATTALITMFGYPKIPRGTMWPGSNTTAGVDEFWFCGSSVIVWRAAGVVVASPTKRGCDRDRAALPRRDAR